MKSLISLPDRSLSVNQKTSPLVYAFFASLVFIFTSCHHDKDVPAPGLSITSVSPDHAAASATVTINGTGFSSEIAKNTVKVNGMAATVQTASATSLTITIPAKAGSGLITVTVDGKTASASFTYDKSYWVSTFAGKSTVTGTADGTGASAEFNAPIDIYRDVAGNMYITDFANHNIRTITANAVVTTFAGNGPGSDNGPRDVAKFVNPYSLCKDISGTIFVAEGGACNIRRIGTDGMVSLFAGSSTAGAANGTGTGASFHTPSGICADAQGNLYVADLLNDLIRKITPAGAVSTFAGGIKGSQDGTGTAARFDHPYGICIDGQGNLYVTEVSNNTIRKITPAGVVTTLAGGSNGYADGTGTAAKFSSPEGICIDNAGNLYVADYSNGRIRKVTAAGVVSTVAGRGIGYADGSASQALFHGASGICVDGEGNLYVAEFTNHVIRKISFE